MSDKLIKELDSEISTLEKTVKENEANLKLDLDRLDALKRAKLVITGKPVTGKATSSTGKRRGRPKGSHNKPKATGLQVSAAGVDPTAIAAVRRRARKTGTVAA